MMFHLPKQIHKAAWIGGVSAISILVQPILSEAGQPDDIPHSTVPRLVRSLPDTIVVTIEIPAGSNEKIEIDKRTGTFTVDRIIQYLPYPANYGFISGTLSGDGDPLDVILLSKRVETGTQMEAHPLATMLLRDKGEIDDKVLAIPLDPALRISECTTWECFQKTQPDILRIIETWFLSYKGPGVMVLTGWAGADSTRTLISSTRSDAQRKGN